MQVLGNAITVLSHALFTKEKRDRNQPHKMQICQNKSSNSLNKTLRQEIHLAFKLLIFPPKTNKENKQKMSGLPKKNGSPVLVRLNKIKQSYQSAW